jgi:cytochrome c biogenesis protein CcdA
MLRATILVITIGLADSVNPTTIGPALYLAAGRDARRQVVQFTLAVFAVFFLGGLIIALGPGQLLLSLVPHPHRRVSYILEVVAGVALLTGSLFLWSYRQQLRGRKIPIPNTEGKASAKLGATISAVEFPTAFPYFAAIAAIVGSGIDLPGQVALLVLFNVCFVAPLGLILATLTFAGARASEILSARRKKLERNWPTALAVIFLIAGVFVTLLGVSGLVGLEHGHVGRIARHIRRFLHP